MITAKEARNRVDFYKNHLEEIGININDLSANGADCMFVYSDKLPKEVKEKLNDLGYSIEYITGTTLMDKPRYKISW